MIGALISMKLLGGKTWLQSLIFWGVILVIGFALGTGAVALGLMTTLLSILIFILLAHYWYKLPWLRSIIVWVVAFVIDFAIMLVLVTLFVFSFGWGGIPVF